MIAPLAAQLDALALAPLRARARRSILAVLAIAAGVALGLAVNLVNDAALTEMQQALRTVSGTADLRIEGASRTIDEALYGQMGQWREVEAIAPVIELNAALARRQEPLKIMGIDPLASARLTPQLMLPRDAQGSNPLSLLDGTRVAVSPALQAWLQQHRPPATMLTLSLPGGNRDLHIAGVLSGIEGSRQLAVIDIAAAQELFGLQGQLTRLDLRLAPGTDRAALLRALAVQLPPGVRAVAPEVHEQQAANLSRAYRVNLTMLAMIALFSGSLLVFSTQMLSVAERAAELAFLRVIGVTARGSVGLMLFEAVLLGTAGAVLGAVLGYALAWSALHVIGGDLGAGYFEGTRPVLTFAPRATLLFMLLGAGAAIIGAWVPALAAARAAPAQALKTGTLHDGAGTGPPPLIGAALLLGGALLAFAPAVRGIPVLGYLSIASLLIGTILLTPAMVAALFRMGAACASLRPGTPATLQLAITRLANVPAQAGISLAAVLAAAALAVAMAIMVVSFRNSVENWLEQMLPAPYYLRQTSALSTRTPGHFDARVQAVIRGTPGVTRAEFVRTETLTLDPARPAVALIIRTSTAADDAGTRLPLVKQYPATADGLPRVWISESFADLYRSRIAPSTGDGGTFELPLPLNPNGLAVQRVRVAGVWRDYARQHGAIVIRGADFARLTGDARLQEAALWLGDNATAAAVLRGLKTRLPDLPALEITETTAVRARSLGIFDRTFTVTYALEAVAVVIGLAGMAAAFMGLIVARKKEFGMLRHLGLTQRELRRMVTLEGAALAALGALLGMVLGVMLAAVLVYVINPQSFGWSMDFHIPVLQLAIFAAALIVAATASSWLTARHVLDTQDLVRAVREDW